MTVGLVAPERPYKGLRPFEDTAVDALLFFGREGERELIAANLMAARLTVLYGASGVGKSSVLRAGVVHDLREQARGEMAGFAVALYSTWSDDAPIDGIAEAVRRAVTEVTGFESEDAGGTLAERLAAMGDLVGGDIYVVLDQFDEYFLYHGAGGGPLLEELPALVTEPRLRVNVLLGIREDALARLDVFKARIPTLFANYLRLERLGREAARAAIVGPLARWSRLDGAEPVEIEPALVDAVLDEVAVGRIEGNGAPPRWESHTIEPPYLQIVLERIWDAEQEAGSHVLRLATLQRLGGARRIVGEHLDRALEALDPAERNTAAAMFTHLVTPSGAKVAHDVQDLAGYAGVDEADARRVASRLVEERILRPVEGSQGDGARVEIFHDVLAAAVAAWRRDHQAAHALEAERADARRRHRRLLVVAVVALVALAAMTAVAVYAVAQQREADHQRALARVQASAAKAGEYAAQALLALRSDPARGLELAARAASVEPTARAEDVLRTALVESRQRAILGTGRAAVRSAAFSPDGRMVAMGDASGQVIVAARRGPAIAQFSHPSGVNAVAFAGHGRLLVTAGDDHTVGLWDLRRAKRIRTLHHGGAVTDVAVSTDGTVLATAGADGQVRIWALQSGALRQAIPFPSPVEQVSLDSDARRVLAVGGGKARLFDTTSGRLLTSFERAGRVNDAALSSDGRLVATGHTAPDAGIARVWDSSSGRLVREFAGHTGAIVDVDFSPVGPYLVTASTDYTARVYNVAVRDARQFIGSLIGHTNPLVSARFTPDGRRIVTASEDKTAAVWKIEGNNLMTLRGHRNSVTGAEMSLDGRYVLTWSRDGTTRVWDPEPDPVAAPIAHIGARAQRAEFAANGSVVATVDPHFFVRVAGVSELDRTPLPHPGGATDVLALSADGRLVALGLGDGICQIATAEGLDKGTIRHGGRFVVAAFNADGRRLVTAGPGGLARIWNVADGKRVRTVRAGRRTITAAALNADGSRLALGDGQGRITVWNATRGTFEHQLRGHRDNITSIAFSPNGRLLVTGSRDHRARIWRVRDGRSLHELRRHSSLVRGVAFSPDSRWVVTVGEQRVGLWASATGTRVVLLQGKQGEGFLAAAFAANSRVIRTADTAGIIRQYGCDVCGRIDELRTLAERRLDALRARRN